VTPFITGKANAFREALRAELESGLLRTRRVALGNWGMQATFAAEESHRGALVSSARPSR